MAELLSVHEKVTGTNVQVHAFRSLNFSPNKHINVMEMKF